MREESKETSSRKEFRDEFTVEESFRKGLVGLKVSVKDWGLPRSRYTPFDSTLTTLLYSEILLDWIMCPY